ncbi:MAG: ATP-binding protein [Eubacteriales bacterium]|nr:ATP-binding protein [Eubacteriales bacterium]
MNYGRDLYRQVMNTFDDRREQNERRAEVFCNALAARSQEFAEITRELGGIGARLLAAGRAPGNREENIAAVRTYAQQLRERRTALLRELGYDPAEADVHYDCELCKDTGYTEKGMCSCLRRALAEAQLESSGLGVLCRTCRFDNFSLDYYNDTKENRALMEITLRAAKRYAAAFHGKNSGNLLFFGATGLGKTHLCCAVAREVAFAGYTVLYCSAQTMFNDFSTERFRSNYTQPEDRTQKYFEAELLILDDLGTEMGNQFSVSCLYEVLNARLVTGMPVIVNTNLGRDELRDRYGDRITSRLFGEYQILPFVGRDIRGQKIR